MPLTVIYTRVATAEIDDIAQYLEGQRPGTGVQFFDELERINALLEQNPALYQAVEFDIRRAVVRGFPYGLFYFIDGLKVVVLACFHLQRAPRPYMDLLARR